MSAFARADIIVKAPYWGFFVSAKKAGCMVRRE